MYKAFNTFIDDVFAFAIAMPMVHRLACLRDDVVFFIYLYQRWLYPVDKKRANEFGRAYEDAEEEEEDKKAEKEDDETSEPPRELAGSTEQAAAGGHAVAEGEADGKHEAGTDGDGNKGSISDKKNE